MKTNAEVDELVAGYLAALHARYQKPVNRKHLADLPAAPPTKSTTR